MEPSCSDDDNKMVAQEKKRPSPQALEDESSDVDAGSAAKRRRNHEDAEKENQAAAPRNSMPSVGLSSSSDTKVVKDLGIKPPECGILTRIYCENFMCHRKFTVDLCRNVNFIYGQNGSGKSAILAAIQICLGAGARRTHRARNLKDLVRKDSTAGYAKVRVTLLNKGDDAYKHEMYGDQITVERTIATKGGYNGYKLYDENMNEKSRSKKDLDDLLDKVNAQVENPVAILDQEEAKKFLTGKAEDKYAFFMKATELERIDRTIASTTDSIMELHDQEKRVNATLDDDVELVRETKKQYDQHKEIGKMEKKLYQVEEALAWSMHQEANQLLQDELDQVRHFREKAAKKQEELTQAEAASQDGDSEEIALRNKLDELAKEAEEQGSMKRQLEQELKMAVEPKKALERNLKFHKKEQSTAEKNLADATRRLKEKREEIMAREGSAESEAAQRTQRLQEAEGKLVAAKEKYDETKQAVNDFRLKYDEVEPKVRDAHSKVLEAGRILDAIESKIRGLQSSVGNSLAVFGQRCSALKKEIDRNQQHFEGRVVGPVGAFVKVVPGKEQFASLAEHALGNGTLDRFVVTNDHDRKVLQGIRRKVGCQADCGVFQVSAHSKYNIPGPPVSGIETVASVLNISDDLIFNCLVDNCKIDEKALAVSREVSEQKLLVDNHGKYSIRGKIRNVYYYPEGDSWSLMKGNMAVVSNSNRLKKTIGVDSSAAIVEANREADVLKEELVELRRDENRWEVDHHNAQKSWNVNKREMQKLQGTINKIVEAIDAIKGEEDSAVNFDTDTSEIEQDVAEAKEAIDQLKDREEQIKTEIEEKEPQIVEIQDRLEEVKVRNNRVINETEQADADLTRYMSNMTQKEEKLEKKRKKVLQFQEIIQKQESKITDITDDVQKYLSHSRRLAFARMSREELQSQTIDGVEGDASQISQEPTDEELEAIEVCIVEKDSNYYRTKVEKMRKRIDDEKERRNASKEDALAACEKYVRAKEQLDGKLAQVKEIKTTREQLVEDVRLRKRRWKTFRKHIANKTSLAFDEILNQKGSSGTVDFDFEEQSLDLIVQKDSADANSQQKDVKALSGGERSYTTIALLLALGESLETPFRILDEFDVFLDPVTRKLTIEALIRMAKSMSHRQFVFITPQDVSNVETDPMLKVHKMMPPTRSNVAGGPSQQTLDFSQS